MTDTLPLADRIAMILGGGLILLGVAGMGLIEVLAGPPFAPVTSDGAAASGAVFGADIRAYLTVAGMLVFGLYAIYRVVAPALGMTTAAEGRKSAT